VEKTPFSSGDSDFPTILSPPDFKHPRGLTNHPVFGHEGLTNHPVFFEWDIMGADGM